MWKFLTVVVFSVLWAFIASQEFDHENLNLTKTKTGCNSTLNISNSRFDLNDHTSHYDCFWIIEVADAIQLFFIDVFLHEKDDLNIYRSLDDAKNKTNPLLKNPIPSQNGTMTVITNEKLLVIYLRQDDFPSYERVLEGFYSVGACSVPLAPHIEILYQPTYLGNFSDKVECIYRFNQIPHERVMQVFTFEEFNMPSSEVKIQGSTLSSEDYNAKSHPTDFFIDASVLSIHVKQALNSTDHFRLKIHNVDKSCSGIIDFSKVVDSLTSPPHILNNGSITAFECRWLVQSKASSDILGIKFDRLDFKSVFDMVAVNDGRSEISPPLLQVTISNRNESQDKIIRASGSSLWVAFKPLNYESAFTGSITNHEQGGHFRNSGNITMHSTSDKGDTAFLLEVKDDEVVLLQFDDSNITPPAVVSVYDGFDTKNLITSLHGQIKFPILSRSSHMMVTGTNFFATSNHFSAKFKGVASSCNHMSSSTSENYILSENCNNSCVWIIPPKNATSAFVIYFQYIGLKEGDTLAVHKLDDKLTELAKIGANQTYIPHISVPGDVGVLINITQGECKEKTEKVIFIGHSSYVPVCNNLIAPKTSEFFQISSPLYPDTYPVFSQCRWNITASKDMIAHMTFQTFNLAENHCIRISQNSKVINQFEGRALPNDLFLYGDVLIDFDSAGCGKALPGKSLSSDTGFLLNMTFTECGAILDNKDSGEFNTNITGSQTICMWKVSVPPTNGKSVNIITYNIVEKDKLKNYEFDVHDGLSVRDPKVTNKTESEIWSLTNTLIFVYKRLDPSKKSSVFQVTYRKQSCDTLCDNDTLCMHPNWRCDGVGHCKDFSDERNCGAVPIPREVYTGYSATAFWLCLIAMTVIGVILGVTVPVCYQKFRDTRYRRFQELDTS